ncbi:MAG: hypothetical protein M3447_11720, partial [Acidobacteriota bacterium]|nr:hypothetical protein [Acidobacteriota bacterium]
MITEGGRRTAGGRGEEQIIFQVIFHCSFVIWGKSETAKPPRPHSTPKEGKRTWCFVLCVSTASANT